VGRTVKLQQLDHDDEKRLSKGKLIGTLGGHVVVQVHFEYEAGCL
jgi:hypothetical protein